MKNEFISKVTSALTFWTVNSLRERPMISVFKSDFPTMCLAANRYRRSAYEKSCENPIGKTNLNRCHLCMGGKYFMALNKFLLTGYWQWGDVVFRALFCLSSAFLGKAGSRVIIPETKASGKCLWGAVGTTTSNQYKTHLLVCNIQYIQYPCGPPPLLPCYSLAQKPSITFHHL